MFFATKSVLALLLVAVTVSSCVGFEHCPRGGSVNLPELEVAAKGNKVEEALGKPGKSVQTENGRVDAYRVITDEGCVSMGLIMGAPIVFPSDLPATGYITIGYDESGSYSETKFWGSQANSLSDAIEKHRDWAKFCRKYDRPIEEVIDLDAKFTGELERICSADIDIVTRWTWRCVRAHKGDSGAQHDMVNAYRLGLGPTPVDLVQAYKWTRIHENSGGTEAEYHFGRLAGTMTADEIAEAEQRAAEWQPNPMECQTLSIPAGSSTQAE